MRELLGDKILDSDEERFGFYWVGKQDAKRAAAEPTRKTLRPIVEDSVDWDNTQNLYIEGDNLEVLKLLQRAYLGKVKMIYIDPPYNTGNDFVYDDDFAMSREEMDEAMGNLDEEGNRLRRNLDSNPRYHSDWCSMIYSRLLVARTLLSNDGVIFISIDDNEVHHLRKICDEVFGASNFVANICHKSRASVSNDRIISENHNHILFYAKSFEDIFAFKAEIGEDPILNGFNLKDGNGEYRLTPVDGPGGAKKGNPYYEFLGVAGYWRYSLQTMTEKYNQGLIVKTANNLQQKFYRHDAEKTRRTVTTWWDEEFLTSNATRDLVTLMGTKVFDSPKHINVLLRMLRMFTHFAKDSLILDFFSGSATTAHAVMQLNAEDGGKRKYICVQLPEQTPEGSEARKAGYDTICEIGKERIRKAGKDILGKLYTKQTEILSCFARSAIGKDVDKDPKLWQHIEDEATREQAKQDLEAINERIQNLDTGFRVLRVDTSNMEEVYFEPAALQQDQLFAQMDSVKEDRNDLDLLFGCMVDWGVELSYPLRQEEVAGKHLYIVNEGALVACFEEDIDLEVIRAIAKLEPLRVLFRESCFASDADKLNIYEQFKQLCGWSAEESYRRIHVM